MSVLACDEACKILYVPAGICSICSEGAGAGLVWSAETLPAGFKLTELKGSPCVTDLAARIRLAVSGYVEYCTRPPAISKPHLLELRRIDIHIILAWESVARSGKMH